MWGRVWVDRKYGVNRTELYNGESKMRTKYRSIAVLAAVMILLFLVSSSYSCSSIVVGKKASKDGSVLFGHNEDDGGQRVVNVWLVPRMKHQKGEFINLLGGAKIPQVEETWALLWFQVNGLKFSDYYLNEWGVAVASDGCPSREDRPDLTDGGIGFLLRRIVAERARTARQGVKIAGDLLDKFGYNSSGRTLVIADPNEAWFLAIVAGKHWVAERVPDDGVVFLPNVYIIRHVDFRDTTNFITSRDNVRDYAIKRGWYNPGAGKAFDFAYTYMRIPGQKSKFTERGYDTRQWRGQQLVTGKAISVKNAKKKGLPFAVKPNRKLGVQDIMAILRDHYEGTEYGPANEKEILAGLKNGAESSGRGLPWKITINPNSTTERTICTIPTQFSTVAQLRNWMPVSIGTVLWLSMGRPDVNVFVPWYPIGMKRLPSGFFNTSRAANPVTALKHHFDSLPGEFDYNPQAAFWIFNDLENLIDIHYYRRAPEVISLWKSFEEQEFAMQKSVEATALQLWKGNPDQAREYITQYTISLSDRVLDIAKKLIQDMKSRFYH